MKRYILILNLLIILFCFKAYTQNTLTPGEGFVDVHIGMNIDNLIEIIGKPLTIITKNEEKEKWESVGYNVSKHFSFCLKFDKVYIFENENKYAIWKVFVKKGKVVYINFSSYIYNQSITENINVSSNFSFYDNLKKVIESLGNKYNIIAEFENNTEYLFLDKGISFIINESEIRNILLFKPIKRKKKKKIIKKLNISGL